MRRGLVSATTLVAALLAAGGAGAAARATPLAVKVDRAEISTQLGKKFVFTSTITNRGSGPTGPLIAHLNVLSLRPGTYVDPEDWSGNRTRYLAPIRSGGSTTTTWRMQAVNDGSFGVYVAVLPRSGAARPPVTGPAIEVAVAERKTLNSGGILPLALGVPGLIGLTALTLRLRRRA
jgi:hypothetical protein